MKRQTVAAEDAELFGGEPISGGPESVAAAIGKILKHRGMPVNEPQLLIWCEYDHGRWARKQVPGRERQPLKPDRIRDLLNVYLGNWYQTHIEWLSNPQPVRPKMMTD